jgi:hypothetical protein
MANSNKMTEYLKTLLNPDKVDVGDLPDEEYATRQGSLKDARKARDLKLKEKWGKATELLQPETENFQEYTRGVKQVKDVPHPLPKYKGREKEVISAIAKTIEKEGNKIPTDKLFRLKNTMNMLQKTLGKAADIGKKIPGVGSILGVGAALSSGDIFAAEPTGLLASGELGSDDDIPLNEALEREKMNKQPTYYERPEPYDDDEVEKIKKVWSILGKK